MKNSSAFILLTVVWVILLLSGQARAASVGPAGYANSFGVQPSAADWATFSQIGNSFDSYDPDTEVNANITASGVTAQTTLSASDPPIATPAATWSSTGLYLQTRPTMDRYIALMGKFVNNSGTNATQISLSYLFTVAAGPVVEDTNKGTRVYYSLSGLANSWTNLPALNVNSSNNLVLALSTNLALNWPIGGNLYLLWVDDNGLGSPDPADQIDNFSLQVTAGTPPGFACNLTGPTNNTLALSTTPVNATVALVNGTAPYKVEYFTNSGVGNTVFASAATNGTAPYNLNLGSLPAATYHLYAVATDSAGSPASANSLTNAFVVVDPLGVTLTAPVDGAAIDHNTSVSSTASVSGGTSPYSVQFYLDGGASGAPVIAAPYFRDFGPLFVGDHTIRATATDARGWVSNSLISTVHITGPLAVTLTPTNGTSYNYGQAVTLSGSPGGGNGPYTLTFYTNGQPVGSLNSSPFSTNLGILPSGSYTSYVQAVDSSGPSVQQASSTTNIIVVLANPVGATLTSPTNGQTVTTGQPFLLTANASVSAPLTVSNVEFFLDGISAGVDTTAPYSRSITPAGGPHTVYAVATDSLARKAYPATNQMTAIAPVPPANDQFTNAIALSGATVSTTGNNLNATKEFSAPFPPPGEPGIYGNAGGASVWWTWTAAGSGLTTIDTFGSSFDTLLAVYTGTVAYPNPSNLSLIASNDDSSFSTVQSQVQFTAVAGTLYHITVDGYSGVQGNIALHIQGQAPVSAVTITSPTNGTKVLAQVSLPVTASALSTNGAVSKVEFFADGTKFGESASSQYTSSWSNPGLGAHALRAIMTDSLNNSFTSAPVNITALALPNAWVAFNDPGTNGNPNDTPYTLPNVGTNSGLLKDITNGWFLPVGLTLTNSGLDDLASDLVAPTAGTPAFANFNTFISWAESVYIYATNKVGYSFSGLDPAKKYKFTGTAIRGGTPNSSDYSNRWTQAELVGAASATPAHSAGVITAALYPASLSGKQVAWNAGYNNTAASGDVVSWNAIVPAPDGTFTILCSKYAGLEPNGDASTGVRTYAFAAIKLELLPPPDTNAPFVTDVVANDLTTVVVTFSEPIDPASALNPANYVFNPALTISGIYLSSPTTVVLTTSPRDVQLDYTLSAPGVQDQAVPANAVGPGHAVALRRRNAATKGGLGGIRTVFTIIFENTDWANVKNNPNAPYINSLLAQGSYREQYFAHNNQHPSEPNYIFLEAGTNFGFTDDSGPAFDCLPSTNHLTTLLKNANIDWRGYMESMPVGTVGTTDTYPYVGRHDPFAFFNDVTTDYNYATNHLRPYSYFAADLAAGRIGRYNWITPNLTNDMHDTVTSSALHQGDVWLAQELPAILNSPAYSNNGAVFITFDESGGGTTSPIMMAVLSPLAKGGGYSTTHFYDHSSYVRTMQDIFGVGPYLGDAANATNLGELFRNPAITSSIVNGTPRVTVSDIPVGKINYLQASSDMLHWTTITSLAADSPNQTITVSDTDSAASHSQRFYRVVEAP